MNLQRIWTRFAVVPGLMMLAHGAQAQDYPARPITYVVPYTAGASTDAAARIYAQRIQLGKPIVVENRGGAASLIGASHVARQPPDGYTLLHATSFTLVINPALFKKLPYDPARDFTPVALVSSVPFGLVVNPALPIKSVAELIAYARSKPGALTFGSSGPGSAAHLLMEFVRGMTGIEVNHVPYRGVTQGLSDVVAGHVSMIFADLGSTTALARAGKVRMLGITTARRSDVAPEIAPLADQGLPGFDASAWHMVVAPTGTATSIVERLSAAFRAAATEPALRKQLAARGLSAIESPPPAQLKAFVAAETARWGKAVAQAGLTGSQ
jgi:tripartite-type tricarboxylate transporter receptor subunit TctC